MLVLTRSDVRSIASMAEAIDLMKSAFRELSDGRAVSPLRVPIEIEDQEGVTLFMPAFVPVADALGVKIVSVFPRNLANGIPTIHAAVALVDSSNGQPIALMDGGFLTALRTGAVSGAATDLLARADSRTLVVIGAGAQGVTQAAAVCEVRPIERIIVVDRSDESLERFRDAIAREWSNVSATIETTNDASVVSEADVICTATTSKTPVYNDADLPAGVHINAVGAFTPEMQETPSQTVARARVVVDSFEAAYAEAGDLINPVNEGLVTTDHFRVELGHLVAGSAPGRSNEREITFFKSVGNAIQDVVVGRRLVDRALEAGIGQNIDLFA
jgi:ornithine cyclodeaminase